MVLYPPHTTYGFSATNMRGNWGGHFDTKEEAIKAYKQRQRAGYKMGDGVYKRVIHFNDDASQAHEKYENDLVWQL